MDGSGSVPDYDFTAIVRDIETAVPASDFDALVHRACCRRRRQQVGTTLVALAAVLAIAGIALGLGGPEPSVVEPPVVTTGPSPTESAESTAGLPEDPFPAGVQFDSAGRGVLVFQDAGSGTRQVWITGDGGQGWTPTGSFPDTDDIPAALRQSSEGPIVLVGLGWRADNSWRSTDRGEHWTRLRLEAPTSVVPEHAWVEVFGLSEGTAYVVDPTGTIAPWQLPGWLAPGVPSRGQDGSLWLEGTDHGTLGRSTDAVRTWTRITYAAYVQHSDVDSVVQSRDANVAVVVEFLLGDTTRPTALHVTTDAGQTWVRTLPDDGNDTITGPIPYRGSAAVTDNGTLLVASLDGMWAFDSDQGFRRIPDTPVLSSLSRTADGLLYGRIAVPPNERPTTLARSLDDGRTWQLVDLATQISGPPAG